MDLISIIVPVYNAEKYLNRCIDSVLNQTYKNIELILINDGSTDNSLNICQDYANKDNRIKVITQENSGVAVARNKGIEVATGEYIMFLDSDDWYDDNYVLHLYKSIDNADLAIGSLIKVFDDGKTSTIKINEVDDTRYCWPILEGLYISCWRCIFKKELILQNKIKFTPNCRTGEDQEFTFKYMFHTKNINYDNDAIYNYYINKNSVMQQNDYRHFDAVEAILRVMEYTKNNSAITDSFNYLYLPRLVEFAVITLLTSFEKPKHILKYLIEKKFDKLLNSSGIDIKYDSKFIYSWNRSPIWCLRKYYLRKKIGKILRKIKVIK